jgi:hypothetical protein
MARDERKSELLAVAAADRPGFPRELDGAGRARHIQNKWKSRKAPQAAWIATR